MVLVSLLEWSLARAEVTHITAGFLDSRLVHNAACEAGQKIGKPDYPVKAKKPGKNPKPEPNIRNMPDIYIYIYIYLMEDRCLQQVHNSLFHAECDDHQMVVNISYLKTKHINR